MKKIKVIIVMPAYNAAKTLEKTYHDIPVAYKKHVMLVDDGSHDKTVSIAKKLGIQTIVHPQNRGYGGNQKTCYTFALSQSADIIVMVHPDYQYDATKIDKLISLLTEDGYDVALGSRIRAREEALKGGMPLYKYLGNRFLTIVQNIILGQNVSEYHTGLRAFKKNILIKIPFHSFSDDFVFDQEILVSAIRQGYRIGETPVPVRYFPDASSINLRRSIVYGLGTLYCLCLFLFDRVGIYTSSIFAKSRKI